MSLAIFVLIFTQSIEMHSDTTIRLWDVSSGQCIRVLMGHSGAVSALAFAPNGRTLLSGGMGGVAPLI